MQALVEHARRHACAALLERAELERTVAQQNAVDLKQVLEHGVGRPLPAAVLFNYANVEALADYADRR